MFEPDHRDARQIAGQGQQRDAFEVPAEIDLFESHRHDAGRRADDQQTAAHADPGLIPLDIIKGPMAALLVIVVYAVLMKFTGYFVSTAIFLPFGMFALGQRNWKAILGVTVGLELFVYVLFVMQLQLRMP